MIKNLSLRIARGLGRQLHTSEGDIEIYAYGLEIFLGSAFQLVLLMVISLLLGIFWPAFLALIAFAGFRVPGGGVHLSSYSRCLFASLTLILTLALLAAVLPANTEFLLLALFLVSAGAVFIIIMWVPAGTEKNAVTDPVEIKNQKIKTLCFFLLWLTACSFLAYYGKNSCALALINGAAGGLFLVTPWGYRIFDNLENVLTSLRKHSCNHLR